MHLGFARLDASNLVKTSSRDGMMEAFTFSKQDSDCCPLRSAIQGTKPIYVPARATRFVRANSIEQR
jgi:hypothetical protein